MARVENIGDVGCESPFMFLARWMQIQKNREFTRTVSAAGTTRSLIVLRTFAV